MRIAQLLLIAVILCVTSCKGKAKDAVEAEKDNLYGTWQLQDVSSKKKSSSTSNDQLLDEAVDNSLLETGLLLSLFKDGSYTQVDGDGSFSTGQWQKDEVSNIIKLGNGLQAKTEQREGQTILFLNNSKQKIELEFVKTQRPLSDFRQDPFYAVNNSWRATTPDSAAAIHQKLTNYIQHLAYLLKAAKERNAQTISFEFSQGIVKIYNGGIGILPWDRVAETWSKSFQTERGAATAYQLFNNYLQQSPSYKGASKGDWVEDDYNILLSIYADFKTKKLSADGKPM